MWLWEFHNATLLHTGRYIRADLVTERLDVYSGRACIIAGHEDFRYVTMGTPSETEVTEL